MPQPTIHPKLLHPANDFIAEQLPTWLRRAGAKPLALLRACMTAHLQSQKRMAAASQQLQPLERFAALHFEQAMKSQLKLEMDLTNVNWREERRRLKVSQGQLQAFEAYFVTVPALQKLLQNFMEGESFFTDTALIDATTAPGEPVRVITQRVDDVVQLCRSADVGQAYQDHLDQVLTASFKRQLAIDRRLELAVAIEIAALKGQLAGSDLRMLREVGQGKRPELFSDHELNMSTLQILGHRVDGAIVFQLVGTPSGFPGLVFNPRRLLSVLLYLPDDPVQPLRRYDDWRSANRGLVAAMGNARFRQSIARRIALGGQADYQQTLGKRLLDDQPDLEPCSVAAENEAFIDLAVGHVQRIKDDAAFLAVPTAQANTRAASERLRKLETAGLVLLNLVGFFVPAVGALLLADLARQVLGEVFEGARDWAQGHQHEALEHLLQVATTVAAGAAVATGVQIARSTFVEQLEPVLTEADKQRLWHYDLRPYQAHATVPTLTELDNGLLSDGQAHWWRCEGVLYRVRRDTAGTWRLLHRDGAGVFGPSLESNGERAWRLRYERPLEWQGSERLLMRLWPGAAGLSPERISQILTVADVDEAHLRGLLVEGRHLPVALRDTLERFAVDDRIEVFFAELGAQGHDAEALQWCNDRLGLQGLQLSEQIQAIQASAQNLRAPMLEHFAKAYLVDDPLLATLKGSFAGLPDAYALDLLKNASVELRQRMVSESRVPMALAEQARAMLQQARLTRVREALFLRNGYNADWVTLVFALLRRRSLAPGSINLILREGSAFGPALEKLFPEQGGTDQGTVMVWRDGSFDLYDGMGQENEIEVAQPHGLFEVLAACLPSTFLQREGWAGEGAAARIRVSMQGWLPRDRLELIRLLGWREARPVASPLHRLPDGRVGYLLSGRGTSSATQRQVLLRRIRSLYPSFDDDAVERFLQMLLRSSHSAYANLLHQEQQYRRLDESLVRWTDAVSGPQRGQRQLVASAFRHAWRLEGDRVHFPDDAQSGLRLGVLNVPAGGLPVLPVGTDFGHITDLALVGLRLQALPAGFLNFFPGLRRLDLSRNALLALPQGLEMLPRLRYLHLASNRIRMTAPHAGALAQLVNLRTLDLSGNPLGAISLRFNQLSRLRELHLYRTGLQVVPDGLEWCGLLEHADLRNNQISSLPQALIDAPLALRQRLLVEGNALSVADRERLYAVQPGPGHLQGEEADILHARTAWLATLDEHDQLNRSGQWDALRQEPGNTQFFLLLAELIDSADFRLAREDLSRRVWGMVESASHDTRIREELFDRAADPRTCVDSVAHCFSQLEVRMRVLQVTFGGDPIATRDARLLLAQRMFRLDEVERIARADCLDRLAEGHAVDEVEVSLAYRTGLASRLNLIGQPRTLQFRAIAGVTQAHLDQAYATVLRAETGVERVRYISQRDFWAPYLRVRYPEAYARISDDFDTRMDTLDQEKEALSSSDYVKRCEQLKREREQAFDALALQLTEQELNMPLQDRPRQGV
ncbi:NEL-type E3 ubiquitin ligase domain-containing protein [Pseudomonas sp. URIL14HWK12:I5]|uniref:NEL-type E3 ubiquitin ligase domain-containing protein n=1 Tax=Pseudomonas sp. URIL14HWK12:I5 TaxID=1261630 RepID=UPI0009D8B507|nr:Leucine rich repeat-containing protein [Pseudomonas sp. URIL14HWK12:I5]